MARFVGLYHVAWLGQSLSLIKKLRRLIGRPVGPENPLFKKLFNLFQSLI